jgi:hypothetical protein
VHALKVFFIIAFAHLNEQRKEERFKFFKLVALHHWNGHINLAVLYLSKLVGQMAYMSHFGRRRRVSGEKRGYSDSHASAVYWRLTHTYNRIVIPATIANTDRFQACLHELRIYREGLWMEWQANGDLLCFTADHDPDFRYEADGSVSPPLFHHHETLLAELDAKFDEIAEKNKVIVDELHKKAKDAEMEEQRMEMEERWAADPLEKEIDARILREGEEQIAARQAESDQIDAHVRRINQNEERRARAQRRARSDLTLEVQLGLVQPAEAYSESESEASECDEDEDLQGPVAIDEFSSLQCAEDQASANGMQVEKEQSVFFDDADGAPVPEADVQYAALRFEQSEEEVSGDVEQLLMRFYTMHYRLHSNMGVSLPSAVRSRVPSHRQSSSSNSLMGQIRREQEKDLARLLLSVKAKLNGDPWDDKYAVIYNRIKCLYFSS